MHRLKMLGLAAIGTTALWCIPSAPASAGGPLLLAPWALGHLLRAATVPLVAAAAAASASASYGYGEPAYSPPPSYYPNYYGAPPTYYGAPPAYYGYGHPYARYYGRRGYDAAPRLRYSGPHGAQAWHGGGGYYRRR